MSLDKYHITYFNEDVPHLVIENWTHKAICLNFQLRRAKTRSTAPNSGGEAGKRMTAAPPPAGDADSGAEAPAEAGAEAAET